MSIAANAAKKITHLNSLNYPGLILTGGLAYAAGPSAIASWLPDTSDLRPKPMAIDINKSINPQLRAQFQNIVNKKVASKRASGGQNMNYRSIASKYREKRANLRGVLREVVQPGLQSALYALGAGALGSHIYGQINNARQTQKAYSEMHERFPEIADIDPQRVDDYWGLMSQYAPSMTRNPLVAGQFIKNMNDYNLKGVDFPTLKSILDIESSSNKKDMDIMNMLVRGAAWNLGKGD